MSQAKFGTRGVMLDTEIVEEIDRLRAGLACTLVKYGNHSAASKHEILGLMQEEVAELTEAVHSGSSLDIINELLDVAIVAIYGAASLRNIHTDW